MMAIFAAIGLILVTIGVYSVIAYTASRQTHEIGIRMALGARRADVLKLVIRMGARLVVLGLAIGLLVSLGLSRVIASQLWGVSPYDPATLASVAAVLLVTGLVACWVPARRATRVIRWWPFATSRQGDLASQWGAATTGAFDVRCAAVNPFLPAGNPGPARTASRVCRSTRVVGEVRTVRPRPKRPSGPSVPAARAGMIRWTTSWAATRPMARGPCSVARVATWR